MGVGVGVGVCGCVCVCVCVGVCAHVSECMFVVLQSLFTRWPGWVKWMIVWRDWEAALVFPGRAACPACFFPFLLLSWSLFLTEELCLPQQYSEGMNIHAHLHTHYVSQFSVFNTRA